MRTIAKLTLHLLHKSLILLCLSLASCVSAPPTENPIPSIFSPSADKAGRTLVVMLPGRGDRADNFVQANFLAIANKHNLDAVAVDAHLGYYRERNLLPRLLTDVIEPARQRGYENIWLLGVSMGGFGSLMYAEQHSDTISGVILIAPFLGSRQLIEAIELDGGLGSWDGIAEGARQYEVAMWRWLKATTTTDSDTQIVLAFGTSDGLVASYGPLLDVLDSEHVFESDGGHNWKTWTPLWGRIATTVNFDTGER
jgi:pimeloyl-ACP methyl ester carboxylesterase